MLAGLKDTQDMLFLDGLSPLRRDFLQGQTMFGHLAAFTSMHSISRRLSRNRRPTRCDSCV